MGLGRGARASPRAGITDAQWRQAAGEHVRLVVSTGDFPHLARFGADKVLSAQDEERVFEAGLDMVLAGAARTAGTSDP